MILHDLANFAIGNPPSAMDQELYESDTPMLHLGVTKTLDGTPPKYFQSAMPAVPQLSSGNLKASIQEADQRVSHIQKELKENGARQQAAALAHSLNNYLTAQLEWVRPIEESSVPAWSWNEFKNIHLPKLTSDIVGLKAETSNESVLSDLDLAQQLLEKGADKQELAMLLGAKEIIHDLDVWLLMNLPLPSIPLIIPPQFLLKELKIKNQNCFVKQLNMC